LAVRLVFERGGGLRRKQAPGAVGQSFHSDLFDQVFGQLAVRPAAGREAFLKTDATGGFPAGPFSFSAFKQYLQSQSVAVY